MLRKTLVLLLVALELLLLLALGTTRNLFHATIPHLIETLDHEEVGLMKNILRIYRIPHTLTERQVINRIQQVGLSHTVLPQKTIQFWRKLQLHLLQILVIEYRNPF